MWRFSEADWESLKVNCTGLNVNTHSSHGIALVSDYIGEAMTMVPESELAHFAKVCWTPCCVDFPFSYTFNFPHAVFIVVTKDE